MLNRSLTFTSALALVAGLTICNITQLAQAVSNTPAALHDDGAALKGFTAAAGPMVVDEFSPTVHRFFANAAAKEAAHPSYAIENEPGASLKPATVDPKVKPLLGTTNGKQSAKITITPGTSLYGTGEAAGPLLRNGRSVVCWNTDAYGYGDEAVSLYQSHPWVLAVRPDGTAFGVLADTTYRCEVDTAQSNANEINFIADGPSFGVIIIEGATPQDVIKDLGTLTGKMAMPPQWAVGYHQCRYSYFPEARVREIAREFRERKIPCDIIWYDIDYMEGFRVFTFDRGHFPDPAKLNADLHAMGFKNVWMINPGIKSRDERSPNDAPQEIRDKESAELKSARAKEHDHFRKIRDDGKANGVYVKRADGNVYEGEVWPGWCYFPDYTSPKVSTWWGPWYKDFMAMGIDGVWNDMNEPAVFNVKSKTMPEDNRHAGNPELIKPNGKPQGQAGAAGDHARYHNVFGMQMIKSSREGIMAANPEKRPFVLSRANYIGGQRYGATWTGDNTANWYHVEVSIPMVLNVGLSGQPFIGPDIGGFAGNGDGEMFARWMGFGALFPFSRGHTGKDNMNKEPWAFNAQVEATSREALELRYKLLPYFYTLFQEATVNGLPIARPVFFADPADPALRSEDDSFLIGDSLLVQAQVMPDRSRVSPMPKGIWRSYSAPKNPDLPRLFIKGGAIVPSGPIVQFAQPGPEKQLTLTVSPDENGQATGTLYEDAGDGYGYKEGEYALTTYTALIRGNECAINISKREGTLTVPPRQVTVNVLITRDGGAIETFSGMINESEGGAVRLLKW